MKNNKLETARKWLLKALEIENNNIDLITQLKIINKKIKWKDEFEQNKFIIHGKRFERIVEENIFNFDPINSYKLVITQLEQEFNKEFNNY